MRTLRTGLLVAGALVAVLAVSPFTWGKEPYRQVLVSANLNMNVDPLLVARP